MSINTALSFCPFNKKSYLPWHGAGEQNFPWFLLVSWFLFWNLHPVVIGVWYVVNRRGKVLIVHSSQGTFLCKVSWKEQDLHRMASFVLGQVPFDSAWLVMGIVLGGFFPLWPSKRRAKIIGTAGGRVFLMSDAKDWLRFSTVVSLTRWNLDLCHVAWMSTKRKICPHHSCKEPPAHCEQQKAV